MELNRITDERLQELALLPEAAWTAQERALVLAEPAFQAEIDAYRFLYQDLEALEEPVFSPGFEDAILAQLPAPTAIVETARYRLPAWATWTAVSIAAAGLAAGTFAYFPEVLPSFPQEIDFPSNQQNLSSFASFISENGLAFGAAALALAGAAYLDRLLRRNPEKDLSI